MKMNPAVTRKNVIIFHTDQQRHDSLGCMGNKHAHTPNIDRLASEGTVFSRHISSNPVCMPSRASLMTGLYPPGHNVWSNGVALNRRAYVNANRASDWPELEVVPEPPTLADLFAQAGYDAASFGKLHLTPNLAPVGHGYPESWDAWQEGALDAWHGPYYGFCYVDLLTGHGEQPCHSGHYSVWLKREHPEVLQQVLQNEPRTGPVPELPDLYPSTVPSELHHSAWLADRLCEYLARGRAADRPFFAFVGFPDPHHPFTPCYDIVQQFEGVDVKTPFDPNGEGVRTHPILGSFQNSVAHLSEPQRRTILRYTYAMIQQIDMAVGRVVDTLKALGLWNDTILIFTSDHGDFLCDHALLRKTGIGSDALLHVPFILRAPDAGLPARVDTPMSNCDVMSTLAALTGVEPPAWQHGRDIRSVIQNDEEHYALAFCATGKPERANYTVYDATHRLTYYPHLDYVELYDHTQDPGECVNLATRREHKHRVASMIRLIEERMLHYHSPILGRTGVW
jgi:arylsulfatase A-like enzyme